MAVETIRRYRTERGNGDLVIEELDFDKSQGKVVAVREKYRGQPAQGQTDHDVDDRK